MATKQIPDLTPTNTANDTDLAMIRQGVEDKKVELQYIRDRGSALGKTMAVGEFGLGSFAKPITDYFASDDANLINRTGYFEVIGTTLNVPAEGTLHHIEKSSGTESVQTLIELASDIMWFRRRNVSWMSWQRVVLSSNNLSDISSVASARTNLGLGTAATYTVGTAAGELPTVGNNDAKYNIKANNLSDVSSIATARTNLSVYSKAEADGKYTTKANNLSDLVSVGTARTNLSVYSKAEADGNYLAKASNLSDLTNTVTARTNLDVYNKATVDGKYLHRSNNLSDLGSTLTARTNLDVYAKADVYTKTEADAKYPTKANNLSDLVNVATARTNLSVYSKAEADGKYLAKAANLNDLANAGTARTNLGLGTAAVVNTGTLAANVPTITDADGRYMRRSQNLNDVSSKSTARSNLDVFSKSEVTSAIQALYPVGSLYFTTVATNPATALGFGQWEAFGEGRVLVGVGTTLDVNGEGRSFSGGATGGEFEHALTASENGPHNHNATISPNPHRHSDHILAESGSGEDFDENSFNSNGYATDRQTGSTSLSVNVETQGSGTPHNNIQPYIAVYIWKRTL